MRRLTLDRYLLRAAAVIGRRSPESVGHKRRLNVLVADRQLAVRECAKRDNGLLYGAEVVAVADEDERVFFDSKMRRFIACTAAVVTTRSCPESTRSGWGHRHSRRR